MQTGVNRLIPELVAGMRVLERMRIPIGSPAAVNLAPEWMDSFLEMSRAQGQRIDFVAVHVYVGLCPRHFGGGERDLRNAAMRKVLQVRQQLEALHKSHGKPIWVTETNVRPDCGPAHPGANWSSVGDATVHAITEMLVRLMEDLPVVARYAPFNWHSSHPRFAQARAANLWTDSGELTPLGSRIAQLVANGNRVRMLAASQRAVGGV